MQTGVYDHSFAKIKLQKNSSTQLTAGRTFCAYVLPRTIRLSYMIFPYGADAAFSALKLDEKKIRQSLRNNIYSVKRLHEV